MCAGIKIWINEKDKRKLTMNNEQRQQKKVIQLAARWPTETEMKCKTKKETIVGNANTA